MPLAKVHLLEGRYNSARIAQLSKAIQDALIEVIGIPPDVRVSRNGKEKNRAFLISPRWCGH